jgi:hypothetical protein
VKAADLAVDSKVQMQTAAEISKLSQSQEIVAMKIDTLNKEVAYLKNDVNAIKCLIENERRDKRLLIELYNLQMFTHLSFMAHVVIDVIGMIAELSTPQIFAWSSFCFAH